MDEKPTKQIQLLTNSRRNSFGSCHRKHYFEYELGRRPVSDADSLRFGTLAHKGLEAWFLAIYKGVEIALQEARAAILGTNTSEISDQYQIATALALIEGYSARWGGEDFEVLAVEQEFQIPLMNPDTNGISRTFRLAGKVDAVVRMGGRVLILEHKTSGEDIGPDSRYWVKLAIDGQVSGYYMGVGGLGYEPDGCLYDVLRKPSIRPGSVPVTDTDGIKIVLDAEGNRVRTKDGKKFRETASTADGYFLQSRPETTEEWYQRLTEDIATQPDRYYRRLEVPRLDADLVEYLGDMWAVGREIAEAQGSGRWPKNPRSCDVYSGCPYFEVCAGRESIDNPYVFKFVAPNSELTNHIAKAQETA